MRAVLSRTVGGPDALRIEDVPEPAAGRGQVVVQVEAVGINFPDTLIIEDRYQFRPERPFAPGGELSGVVVEVGEGVEDLTPGDRVLAVPGWGALVERIALPAASVTRIPDAMPFEDAAALVLTYGTALYALRRRGSIQAGETLLVLGAAGGVGAAAVELGRALGARVVAAASSEDKLAFARSLGADAGLVYPTGAMDREAARALSATIKAACGGDGADVVLDAVGGDYAEPALRAMNWNGRYLVVGFPAGIPSIPLNLTLLKSVSITGVFWGAAVTRDPAGHAADLAELFRLYADGAIRPRISEVHAFEHAGEAIRALGQRRAMGKRVVRVRP